MGPSSREAGLCPLRYGPALGAMWAHSGSGIRMAGEYQLITTPDFPPSTPLLAWRCAFGPQGVGREALASRPLDYTRGLEMRKAPRTP